MTSSGNQFAIASAFASSIFPVEFSERRTAPFAAEQPVRASVSGWIYLQAPRHCPWIVLDWGCRAITSRGWDRGYGLVDADTPKRASLAWAIQISFLDLLPQFPSEQDLLERRYNRYDKRGVTGESLGAERLIRIRFG